MIRDVARKFQKGHLALAGALLALTAILAACGGDSPTATATRAPQATATQPSAQPTTPLPTTAPGQLTAPIATVALPTPLPQQTFDEQWAALLKAAQAEGEVTTFICCGLGRDVGKLIPTFEKKYGIKWVNSTGSSSQQFSRVEAERKAGKYTLDVWMGGANTATSQLMPAGILTPLKPLLFHPEVLDQSAWYEGGLIFRDPPEVGDAGYILMFAADASLAEISYNTKLVDPNEIQSYWDLLDPKWQRKIVMRDPRLGGTGASTAFYYWHPDLGPDFLRRLYVEPRPTYTEDARQAAEWLAIGRYSICLFACAQEVQTAREQGLPVTEVFPHALKEGSRLSAGGNAMYAVDKPPHPNAQKFFVNWWMSKEGQTFMQDAQHSDSLRIDIPKDNVDPADLRQPGTNYLFLDAHPELDVNVGIRLAVEVLGAAGR